VARYKCKVDDLGWNPDLPQGQAAVPDLVLVLRHSSRQGLAFHDSLEREKRWEVQQWVAAHTPPANTLSKLPDDNNPGISAGELTCPQ
jgi:hypothetical protein